MTEMIEKLDVKIRPQVKQFIHELDSLGIAYKVLETRRTPEVQAAYYAQGREPLDVVNAKRKVARLYLLTEKENRNKITWTLKSKHIDGLAIDIVPVIGGRIPWAITDSKVAAAWLHMGEIGEKCGLQWGGRWTPLDKFGCGRDCPHYEV